MKKFLRITLPWLICAAIFYYLFTQIPPEKVLNSLTFANFPLFTLYAIIYFFLIHILDCLTIKHFISRFAAPISHKESWLVRGVSYLIMIINYHAAQGAFAIYFKKTHNASIAKSLGTLAFISAMDLILVITCAVIAISITPITYKGLDIRSLVLKLAPLIYLLYFSWILFWKNVDKPFMNKLKRFKVINWILKHNVFLIFREAKLKDYITIFLYRLPMIIIIIGSYNFAVFTFQAKIDWVSIYLYNPIIMFVTTLPITPAGLGTGQFLTVEFFKNLVDSPIFTSNLAKPASILFASSLLWGLSNQFIKAIFGIISLTRTSKDLFKE